MTCLTLCSEKLSFFNNLFNFISHLCCHSMQITIDNCGEVERIATDLLLKDLQLNIGEFS